MSLVLLIIAFIFFFIFSCLYIYLNVNKSQKENINSDQKLLNDKKILKIQALSFSILAIFFLSVLWILDQVKSMDKLPTINIPGLYDTLPIEYNLSPINSAITSIINQILFLYIPSIVFAYLGFKSLVNQNPIYKLLKNKENMSIKNFLWRWMFTNILIGIVFYITSMNLSFDQGILEITLSFIFGAALGTLIGVGQTLILNSSISGKNLWIIASTIGSGFAIVFNHLTLSFFIKFFSYIAPSNMIFIRVFTMATVDGIFFGFVLGIAQYLILRTFIHKAFWWILASSIGMGLGTSIAGPISASFGISLASILGSAIRLGIYSAVTGFTMIFLVQRNYKSSNKTLL